MFYANGDSKITEILTSFFARNISICKFTGLLKLRVENVKGRITYRNNSYKISINRARLNKLILLISDVF